MGFNSGFKWLIAFVGWRTGLIIRIGTAWITKDSNCFEYNARTLLVYQAVRHCGRMSRCVHRVSKLHSVTNCTVHGSSLCDSEPGSTHADHARCSRMERNGTVDISGIPVSKGACSVYWSTFDKFLEAFSIGLRDQVFTPDAWEAYCGIVIFLRVAELMSWISVRKFAVLYLSLPGKYNVVPDLHQLTIHNNPLNADGRIGKYRYMRNDCLRNSIHIGIF